MANSEGKVTALTYNDPLREPSPEEINMMAISAKYNLQTYFAPLLNKYEKPNERAFLILCMIETLRLTRPHDQRTAEIAAEEDKIIKECNAILEKSPKAEEGAVKAFMAEGDQEFATDDDAIAAIAEHIKNAVVAPIMFKTLEAIDEETTSSLVKVQGGGALLNINDAEAAAEKKGITDVPENPKEYKELLRILGINSKNAPSLNAVKAKMNVMAAIKGRGQKGGVRGITTFLVALAALLSGTHGAPTAYPASTPLPPGTTFSQPSSGFSPTIFATRPPAASPSATATAKPATATARPATATARPATATARPATATPTAKSATATPTAKSATARPSATNAARPSATNAATRSLAPISFSPGPMVQVSPAQPTFPVAPLMNPKNVAIPIPPVMPALSDSQFKQQAQSAALALSRSETGTMVTKILNALTLSNAQPEPSPYYDTKVVDMLFQATTAIRTDLAATPALADYMTNTLVEAVITDFTKNSMPPKKETGTGDYESLSKFMKTFEGKTIIEDPATITEIIVDIALRRPIVVDDDDDPTIPKSKLQHIPKSELLNTTFLIAEKSIKDKASDWFYTLFGGNEALTTQDIVRVALSVNRTEHGKSTQSVIILNPSKFNFLRPLAIVFGPLRGQMNTKTEVGVALMGFLDSPMAQQLDFLTLAAVGADGIRGQNTKMTQVLAGVKSLNAAAVQGAFLNHMNTLIRQSDDIIRVGEAKLQISAPAANGTFRDVVAIAPAAVEGARVTRSVIISVTDSMFGPPGTAAVATRITNMEDAKALVTHFGEVLDAAKADPRIVNYTKAAGDLLIEVVETVGGTVDTLTRAGLRGIKDLGSLVSIMVDGIGPLLLLAVANVLTVRPGHAMSIVMGSAGISSVLFAAGLGSYSRAVGGAIAAIYTLSSARYFYNELRNGIRSPQPGLLGNAYAWVVRATTPNPPRALLPDMPAPVVAPNAAANAARRAANAANAARRAAVPPPVVNAARPAAVPPPVVNAALPVVAPNAAARPPELAEGEENLRGGYKRRSKYATRKRKNRHLRKTKSVRKSRGARRSRKN